MELATFAYTIGVIELLVGIPLLFYSKPTLKWLDKFLKADDVQIRILGAIIAVLGALVLMENYEVSLEPDGLVILVAWLVFLKGVMFAWWPSTAVKMKRKFMKNEAALTLSGITAVTIGLLLMYAGSIL
jgi:uncharacterized protein YjeT (DUF2065 family)